MPQKAVPKYRHHKPSKRAVVTIRGKDYYLGPFGSDASRAEYARLVGEMKSGMIAPTGSTPTVSEIIRGYVVEADQRYVKDGKPTSEAGLVRASLKPLRQLYGDTLAKDFGPLSLKAMRWHYAESGSLCRKEVNRRIGHIKRLFKWATGNELVPGSTYQGLLAISGLRPGEAGVRDTEKVPPAPDDAIDAVLPLVSRQVRAMIELQRLSGMRPGEVCQMRTRDIDRSNVAWVYRPASHKCQHLGKERTITLGPKARAILVEWLRADPDAYLFQPCEAEAERLERMRRDRKSKVQPSQVDRSKPGRKRELGDRYKVGTYAVAVARACRKACVEAWSPNQLRHTAATNIAREHGMEAARTVLGHSTVATTGIYVAIDAAKAAEVMAVMG